MSRSTAYFAPRTIRAKPATTQGDTYVRSQDPCSTTCSVRKSRVPGSTVRDTAGKATQLAKDNPLAAGALVAVLLGTDTGRQVGGAALKLGGIAAIGGLAYKAYQNYKNGESAG